MILSTRKAFSLTELLIVLVIVAVLFMAALPVVTKRKVNNYLNNAVWNYVEGDDNRNAYFHIGNEEDKKDKSASALIGLSDAGKHGKLTVYSNSGVCNNGICKSDSDKTIQRQIQFRYGQGNGTFAGTLFADKYNMLLGGRYDKFLNDNYKDYYNNTSDVNKQYYNKYNTVLGIDTAENIDMLGRSVIIGNNSFTAYNNIEDLTGNTNLLPESFDKDKFADYVEAYANISNFQNLIAIGNNVYSRGFANLGLGENHGNIFIGHNSAGILNSLYEVSSEDSSKEDYNPADYMNKNNTIVGYNALPSREEIKRTLYQDNVILGANTGGYYREKEGASFSSVGWNKIARNVIIGSEYKSNNASDNVIIGYGAYDNSNPLLKDKKDYLYVSNPLLKDDNDYIYDSDPGIKYLTAIGYGACNSIGIPTGNSGAKFPRTCIGVGSAQVIGEYFADNSLLRNKNVIAGNYAYPTGDERIYIGSYSQVRDVETGKEKPVSKYTGDYGNQPDAGFFGGRAPIEVHNVPEAGNSNSIAIGPSVILNTHLVVRGMYYDTVGSSNYDYSNQVPEKVTAYLYSSPTVGVEGLFPNPDYDKMCVFRRSDLTLGEAYGPFPYGTNQTVPYSYYCNISTPLVLETKISNNLRYYGNCITDQKAESYTELMGKNDEYFPKLKSSDIRLKTDISDNNDGLDKLLQLKPYNYTYKADLLGIPQVGVIAQDLQKIFPNSVTKGKDGFLRIRWDEMFYAMINAIKTLGVKIEKIASDISGLEISTLQIKNQHRALKKEIVNLNARAARLERK